MSENTLAWMNLSELESELDRVRYAYECWIKRLIDEKNEAVQAERQRCIEVMCDACAGKVEILPPPPTRGGVMHWTTTKPNQGGQWWHENLKGQPYIATILIGTYPPESIWLDTGRELVPIELIEGRWSSEPIPLPKEAE